MSDTEDDAKHDAAGATQVAPAPDNNLRDANLREGEPANAAYTSALAVDVMFPDFKCLRCGDPHFWVEKGIGATDVIVGRDEVNRSRVEFICQNCGMIESHSASILINSAWKNISGDERERQS